MSSYDQFLRMIADEPGNVFSAVGLALVTLFVLFCVGGWLPRLCWGQQSDDRDSSIISPPPRILEIIALMLGGGVMLAVTLGTLSAYVTKSVLPGMVLTGVLGFASSVRLLRDLRGCKLTWGVNRLTFVLVTISAMAMSLWHHVVSEYEISQGSKAVIAYSDLNGDTSFHVYLATSVRDSGLPLRDLYGSTTREYSQVTHTGHGVLIAGLASVLRASEFHVSASLWMSAALLLSWSSMAIVMRSQLSGFIMFVCGILPLMFGPLMIPSFLPFFHPSAALAIDPGISNRMYWNLPQALSTALAAVALVLFDKYCRRVMGGDGERRMLILATLAIVTSGWVKPSLFIFYAPALLVTLAIQRARLTSVALTIGILAVGVVTYLLPGFLVDVPELPPWSFHPNRQQAIEVARFVGFGCGAVLLLAVAPLYRLIRELVHPQEPRVVTLPLVAMGGSLLFALLFREERFVEFKSFQPNIWWGPSASVLLLLPVLIRHAVRQARITERVSILSLVASALIVLHLFNGLQFALATPAINTRGFPMKFADAMQAAQQQTAHETRFLLDPMMAWVDLAAFLRRPALFNTNYMFPEDEQILSDWTQLFEEPNESAGTGWADYDAAIVYDGSRRAQQALQEQGWTVAPLTSGFQLWTRPTDKLNSVDADK
ncbi:MAG: hypothetical protein KDA93_23135 [Planctomycetaceae bacterium]|nr:hypothetical protein [Planctomycetaceae bacterium]